MTQRMSASFAWTFAGSTLYSIAQMSLVVILARLANPDEVGRFALLLAISAPVFMLCGLNLRLLQNTDAVGNWTFSDFAIARHGVNLLATTLTVVVAAVAVRETSFTAAAVAMAGAKSVEGMAQTCYGFLQLKERHDVVARSMMLRALMGPAGFFLGYALSSSLAYGCLGLLAGWLIPYVLWDRRQVGRIGRRGVLRLGKFSRARFQLLKRLVWRGLPLGLDQGVSSLSINAPRYTIQWQLGSAQLGIFATLFYFAQVVSMVTSALGIVVVPRLARYKTDGQRHRFVKLLVVMTSFSVLVSVGALVGGVLIGEPIISFVFGPEYVDQGLLTVVLLGAVIITLQRALGRGLVGAHRFASFLAVDTVIAVTVAASALILTPMMGVVGAAWSIVVGYAIGTLVMLWPLIRVIAAIDAESASPLP